MHFKCIEAEKLYSRDSKLKKQDVEIIQEWLKKQPHLPQIEEMQILIVLHSCFYQVEATKNTIDNYFTIRNLCPQVFAALTPEALKLNLGVACITILPKKTPEGYVVILLKLLDTKTDNFNCANLINCINMVAIHYLHQNGFDEGVVCLFDAAGFSLGHLTRLNINAIKYGLYLVQEGTPVRIKGIHVINAHPIVNKVVVLVKPFLQDKLYNMIKLHAPDSNTIYQSVPKDCLPKDLGGSLPSSQDLNDQNLKNLLDNYEFFPWHDGQKVEESKRVGKTKLVNDVFGVEGTFKKLEID